MSKNKKRKPFKILKVFLIFVLCLIITGGLYVYYGLSKLSEKAEISNKSFQSDNNEYEDDDKNSVNILALGVDIGTPGAKNENDPKRTDTMILIHYNKENKDIQLVSIPRDTLIKINSKNTKINAAHAIGGVEYSVDAVEKLLNIDIDYYGKVNYDGFRKIIDSIGGIDVDINNNMNYDDASQNLHIHFKKGETVHLDGKKAEEFFRWRKNNDGTGLAEGDIGRIENQHIFMSKVIDKVKSPRIIPRIPAILMTLPKYCETNMTADEIIKYGYSFVNASNVNMETLKGDTKYIKGISYFIYDKNYNSQLLAKIQDRQIPQNSVNIQKDNVKIKVLNGTSKSSLASNYRKYLQSKGYSNISIGNGSSASKSKILLQDSFKSKQIESIKKDFKISNIEENNKTEFDITVILGEDYDYIKQKIK
ncbi:MAG: LCP family protein [Clostridium sp.]|nr:LCP family protein [Clostridium sp.]